VQEATPTLFQNPRPNLISQDDEYTGHVEPIIYVSSQIVTGPVLELGRPVLELGRSSPHTGTGSSKLIR